MQSIGPVTRYDQGRLSRRFVQIGRHGSIEIQLCGHGEIVSLPKTHFLSVSVHLIPFRRFAMVTDLWLAQDGIAEGHAIVIDMEGSTLSHLARVNIIAMKKFMYYIQVIAALCTDAFLFNCMLFLFFFKQCRKLCQFACEHSISSTLFHSWTKCWL